MLFRSTIRRILQKVGYNHYKAIVKPDLTKPQALARFNWCKARKDWSPRLWKDVIFTDEASVERGNHERNVSAGSRPTTEPLLSSASFKSVSARSHNRFALLTSHIGRPWQIYAHWFPPTQNSCRAWVKEQSNYARHTQVSKLLTPYLTPVMTTLAVSFRMWLPLRASRSSNSTTTC